MGRKVIGLIAMVMGVLLGGSCYNSASAMTVKQPYMAEQTIGKAPDVKVYLTGSKMKQTVDVSGKLGEITLTQNGDLVPFSESGEGIEYIVLLDNSGSVHAKQLQEAKKQLAVLSQSLNSEDSLTVYTVGTSSASGEKKTVIRNLSGGNPTAQKRAIQKIKKIPYLNTRKSKTVLYRSLNEILVTKSSVIKRTVVLLITDGEDDSKGKDIDNKSTADEVKNATIPVYGVLLNNVSGKPNTEKMNYTQYRILNEKNCRGFYADCSNGSVKAVENAFRTLKQLWNKDTYVVNLKADTNVVTGKSALKLTVNNTSISPVLIDYSDYVKDNESPAIVGEVKKINGKSLSFLLSDENGTNLEDAVEKSHYEIKTKETKKQGKIWDISSVNVKQKGADLKVTITLKEELYTGDYVLTINNIRDNSQDQNSMKDVSKKFKIKDGLNRKSVEIKSFLRSYWWIGLLILVVIIGVVVILLVKKRTGKALEVSTDELMKADIKRICLTITDGTGVTKDVECEIDGSLFVGRSEICNIFFPDDLLSKQHFVIEATKLGCYIEDLESTNGTCVNGVRMTNRRMLIEGDVVTAGRETFVFHMLKNQSL